jgi:hypothetical protein
MPHHLTLTLTPCQAFVSVVSFLYDQESLALDENKLTPSWVEVLVLCQTKSHGGSMGKSLKVQSNRNKFALQRYAGGSDQIDGFQRR